MKSLSLREIQSAELENLRVINDLCKKIGVTYYLAYGTLLGAIRHHGFIPWDDDTDIWMPREDFDKFLKYCKSHADKLKPFKLTTRQNTKNYPYGIPRFCDLRYKYVTTSSAERQFELGVFTDIYPLDNLGDISLENDKKLVDYTYKLNVSYERYNSGVSNNRFKALLKKINYYLLHIIHGKNYAKTVDSKIIKKIKSYADPNNKFVGMVAWDNLYVRYKKEDFQYTRLVDFEGYKFVVPSGYDRILKQTYGDYMKFPPKSERHPYHGYKIYKKYQ